VIGVLVLSANAMNQAARLKPSFEAVTEEILPPPPKARAAADSPKSLRTRARILDAAMRLFVEIGYHAATNARIAEAAHLTRGAMLYHFPDREALVEAVVPYIQNARTRLLQAAMEAAPHGADRTDHAIDSYWRLLSEPSFVAFAELEGAARTDAPLRERIAEAQAAFDRAEMGEHLFDLVQGANGPRFQTSRDLARFMLEGLARSRLTYDADARTERLLTVVKRAARMLNRKGSAQDLWPEG
jgi:AcrR family transcriptional regulator